VQLIVINIFRRVINYNY